ncbi:MAG: hypothetical protein CMJ49_01260 [Planctomycetaceae bacterium]|nr:hypothetical protein [Planctomycetaceae bacterium]
MLGGALEGIGVGLTFTMGVVGGAAAVFIVLPWGLDRWYWYPLATLVLVPYSVFKLWGVLLLPLYLTMLHGLICHEWNRLLCFSILAMVTSIIILISMGAPGSGGIGPALRLIVVEGGLAGLIFVGARYERVRYRIARSRRHREADRARTSDAD